MDLGLPALMGHHQIGNAGTAIVAALRLKTFGITDAAIERGLLDVRWPARMQRSRMPAVAPARRRPELARRRAQPAGAEAIAQTLAELERAPKPVGPSSASWARKTLRRSWHTSAGWYAASSRADPGARGNARSRRASPNRCLRRSHCRRRPRRRGRHRACRRSSPRRCEYRYAARSTSPATCWPAGRRRRR